MYKMLCKSLFLEHMWIAINVGVLVLNEIENEGRIGVLMDGYWRK